MKKIVTLGLMLAAVLMVAALSASALAASVSRNMPSRVSPGDAFAVVFSASGVKAGELFTLEDQVPQGWQVASWSVAGATGGNDKVNYRYVEADNRYGFSFVAESSSPQVTLNVKVSATASLGNYNFDAVYFDSSGQGRSQGSVTVRTITCGDSVCEGSESTQNCASDCPAPPPPQAPQQAANPAQAAVAGASATPAKKPMPIVPIIGVAVVALAAWWLLSQRKKKSK